MHRLRATTLRTAAALALAFSARAAFAQESVPTQPTLSINIPTIQFSAMRVTNDATGRLLDLPWIAEYVSGIYSYAVGVAGLLAGVMFVVGGFQYLTAGGDASRASKGKQRITDALVGLALTLGAYLVLANINTALVSPETLRIRTVQREAFTAEESEDHGDSDVLAASASTGSPKAICRTIADCKKMCESENRPRTAPGIMDPKLAKPIPTIPGLRGNGKTASQAVIDGLTRAAKIASEDGYTISVTSGYRPLSVQIDLVCSRMGNPAAEAEIGKAVAWPGGSNHGAGFAVDLQFIDDKTGTVVVGSGNCTAQAAGTLATQSDSALLDDIMTQAGARRYQNELWHYEFGGATACRCTFPNCPPSEDPKDEVAMKLSCRRTCT